MPSPIESGVLSERFMPEIDFTGFEGRTSVTTSQIEVLDVEFADEDKGLKVVYKGIRADGKPATFETGSFTDNGNVEGADDKHDICVSTAGGCTRSCTFCSVPSADLGFERLLTAPEIVAQVLHMVELRDTEMDNALPNVVGIMGNGEPPDNIALIPAIRFLDTTGLIERTTISTIGENRRNIGKMAAAFSDLTMPVRLQLSLHAADDEKRRVMVPGRATVDQVVAAADDWTNKTDEAVKYNVVLMDGSGPYDGFSNAEEDDARRLASVLLDPSQETGLSVARRLKMSAFNPVPGIPFDTPSEEARQRFVEVLAEEGVTEIKTFKGSGIEIDSSNGTGGFACGQLRSSTAVILRRRDEQNSVK